MIVTKENIKVPYAVEGVIRTASLDDTITPQNSVELAINMNFDRVGASQTRLGVSEYATQLDQGIKNFGTLNNFLFAPGYDVMLGFGEPFDFSTTLGNYVSAAKITETAYVVFYQGADGDGFAKIVYGDVDTGVLSNGATPLEFDTSNAEYNNCIQIDSTHFLNVWSGGSNVGKARVFTVDVSSGTVVTAGAEYTFDATTALDMSLATVDANHVCLFYRTDVPVGKATILEINLGTWAITEPGATFTFDAAQGQFNSAKQVDATHVINFWTGVDSDGFVQCFTINTGTWEITANGSPLEFDTTSGQYNSAQSIGDGEHFINFWGNLISLLGKAQVFAVNPSTFAVTAIGTPLTFATGAISANASASIGDGEHFVNFWTRGTSGFGRLIAVNPSTFAVTGVSAQVSTGVQGAGLYASAIMANGYKPINFFTGNDSDGWAVMFKLEAAPVSNAYLYAQKDNGDIVNWHASAWTTVRTGLKSGQKARFAQYLNYVWMVNGNALLGDPVQTSDGGQFGTALVPSGLPPGDFIHAGFEGRVWIADKTYGIIYYTDIVQFTPPDTYTITYDSTVNFIKDISPQDGETFTALYRVPRALLVFTENHIFRIYGATSLDAYPAYDVGTYSQESIIETKTGIFFHHSSGFYQFDYGGQPVEISRRIIDFVQAIPRAYYDDITGVYDGFDAIEWSIGPVTVSGVLFTNCIVRYTLSTQVWTVYDYVNDVIRAMITFDDGSIVNHFMGTSVGKVGKMDDGFTDFGQPFYYELTDRWRSYFDMYASVKNINGINVYNENAAGANMSFQIQKSGPNVWLPMGTVNEYACSLIPNNNTQDFNAGRLRLAGTTKGNRVVVHGFEILSIQDKGYDTN